MAKACSERTSPGLFARDDFHEAGYDGIHDPARSG